MSVLYYHRMVEGFPKVLYESVSYAAGYSKRSFVLTTPAGDDHVLIDPSHGMDLSFPELPLLNEQGLGPRPQNVHVVFFDHEQPWNDNLNRNRSLVDLLRCCKFTSLYPFTGKSSIVHALARELSIPVRTASADTTFWAEDKKTLLDFGHLTDIPAGYKIKDNDDLIHTWRKLIQHESYPGKAVFKASQAASGVTSTILQSEEHCRTFINLFNLTDLDGGVLEEWHDSDPRSPSVNYFIYPDGSYKTLFVSDQIFEKNDTEYGREGTRIYRGNRFPSSFGNDLQEKIVASTKPLLKALYERGYWGPVGFDTIVFNNNDILVTEINPRITGPHFGWRPMKNLGCTCFSLQNEAVNKNTSFNSLRTALEDVLFSKQKRQGYIILNFFPGKFIGVVLAAGYDGVDMIKKKVAERLRPLR